MDIGLIKHLPWVYFADKPAQAENIPYLVLLTSITICLSLIGRARFPCRIYWQLQSARVSRAEKVIVREYADQPPVERVKIQPPRCGPPIAHHLIVYFQVIRWPICRANERGHRQLPCVLRYPDWCCLLARL